MSETKNETAENNEVNAASPNKKRKVKANVTANEPKPQTKPGEHAAANSEGNAASPNKKRKVKANVTANEPKSQTKPAEENPVENVGPPEKIFVGGLTKELSDDDIKSHFTKFGNIVEMIRPFDKMNDHPKGFCFIIFDSEQVVKELLKQPTQTIKDIEVSVKKAIPMDNMRGAAEKREGNAAPSHKIFVARLANKLSDDDIKSHFTKFGNIVEMSRPFDKMTNQPKGFCFITFDSEQVVNESLKQPTQTIKDIEVSVYKSTSKPGSMDNMRGAAKNSEENAASPNMKQNVKVNGDAYKPKQQAKRAAENSEGNAASPNKKRKVKANVTANEPKSQTKPAEENPVENVGPPEKIFVGGLTKELSDDDIKSHFTKFGNIVEMIRPFDKMNDHPKGFCFIIFDSEQVVKELLKQPTQTIKDIEVSVKKAIPMDNMRGAAEKREGNAAPSHKIFVARLANKLSDDDIKSHFTKFGNIVEMSRPFDKMTNQPKGFCFITFDSEQVVNESLKQPTQTIKDIEVSVYKSTSMPGSMDNMRGAAENNEVNAASPNKKRKVKANVTPNEPKPQTKPAAENNEVNAASPNKKRKVKANVTANEPKSQTKPAEENPVGNVGPPEKIFVGGLTKELSDDDIKSHFTKFGNIVEMLRPFDKMKDQPKGFCFFTFDSEQVATELLKQPTQTIKDIEVSVKKAIPMDNMRGAEENPVGNVAPSERIFVGGLTTELSDDDIKSHFMKFGNIVEMLRPFDKMKNQPKGFCFITFDSEQVVEEVSKQFKQTIKDIEVIVKKSTPKPGSMDNIRGAAEKREGNAAPSNKIFVARLANKLSDDDIKSHFTKFGNIVEMSRPFDKMTNQPKGFCFITFDSEQVVNESLKQPTQTIKDIEVSVYKSTSKPGSMDNMRGAAKNSEGNAASPNKKRKVKANVTANEPKPQTKPAAENNEVNTASPNKKRKVKANVTANEPKPEAKQAAKNSEGNAASPNKKKKRKRTAKKPKTQAKQAEQSEYLTSSDNQDGSWTFNENTADPIIAAA